jgi:NADH:ubiquinone oxidoreductase subunit F (NADH-binding)
MRTTHLLPSTPYASLADYRADGGVAGLEHAVRAGLEQVIDTLAEAGVRGRGGAGFPTATKWRGVAAGLAAGDRVDVVVNAAEGEPGTFKDRALMRANPYAVVEGALIAAHVVGSRRVVLGTKAAYTREIEALERAVGELAAEGWASGLEITIVRGPDHYLLGEETALLEVVEGEDPLPRHIPPYLYGLFSAAPQLGWSAGAVVDDETARLGSHPAIVNNAETFGHVALVLRHGAAWYRSMGTEGSPGPAIVTVTGDVATPAVAEIELGHRLRDVIDEIGGGPLPDRAVKAVLSGVSNPVLTAERLDARVSFEDLAGAGGGLGSAGFIVYDDRRNMIDVAYQVARFLHVESCGQCNPCKTGTGDMAVALEQLVLDGAVSQRAARALERSVQTVTDGSRCFLPAQAQRLVPSLLQEFPDDLDARAGGESGDPEVVLPKLVDLADGVMTVDTGWARKRPDWTYGDTPVRLGPRVERVSEG